MIMHSVSVFWPNDIILNNPNEKYVVLGYNTNSTKQVIINVLKKSDYATLKINVESSILKELEILYTINCKSKNHQLMYYDFSRQIPLLTPNQILILFKPSKSWKLEYYSLNPITINIFWNSNDQARDIVFKRPTTDKYNIKLNQHWLDESNNINSERDDMMEELRIINLTNYIRSKMNLTTNNSMQFNIPNYISSTIDVIVTIISFSYILLVQKPCHILSNFLSYPFLKLRYKNPYNNQNPIKFSLSLLSYSFHQINFRVRQLYNLPLQFKKLKISKIESESSILKGTRFSPSEYIKFYNTVWLIINDILLGVIFSNILKANHNFIAHSVQILIPKYETMLGDTIRWLMNSPAGFKLNNELASFLGQLIFWVLDLWKTTTLAWIITNIDSLLSIVEILTSYCGITLFISILLDLTNVIFLNVYGFYIACTRLYFWQISIVMSLFKLFYGKKYNILRNRVDSNNYEFDQLMIGIIMFTILIYLLPTVFIFYLTFVLLRLAVLSILFALKFLLILLNHIPIVVLLLKLKNQERLPSGILLDFQDGYFILKSRPLTLGQIYQSHMNSMLNFNLFNLNHTNIDEQFGSYESANEEDNNSINMNYKMRDVVENWRRISVIHLMKIILFGQTIQDYDYTSMF